MTNKQSDLLKNFFQQTLLGKMNLITLVQNLPEKIFSDIPEIMYDEHGRYLKLTEEKTMRKNLPDKLIKQIERDDHESINDIIQQKTIPVSPASSIETNMSKLSMEERYNCIANEFNLSSTDIEKQYELALKNRIEIPPILMRCIIIDAIGIFNIMMNELNQETEKHEKFQNISKRLNELKAYNQLFDHHC